MKKPDNRASDTRSNKEQSKAKAKNAQKAEDATLDPGAERGERMETGKAIARSGKSTGDVPGASQQRPKQ